MDRRQFLETASAAMAATTGVGAILGRDANGAGVRSEAVESDHVLTDAVDRKVHAGDKVLIVTAGIVHAKDDVWLYGWTSTEKPRIAEVIPQEWHPETQNFRGKWVDVKEFDGMVSGFPTYLIFKIHSHELMWVEYCVKECLGASVFVVPARDPVTETPVIQRASIHFQSHSQPLFWHILEENDSDRQNAHFRFNGCSLL